MTQQITMVVNGVAREVQADPDTPLLDILRNRLGLKGSRFGCGTGSCGACFVLLDGHPTPSCDTPAWAAEGKEVTTVEGLASGDALHEVQQAFLEEQAGQCGYCLSGIMVSAAALLASEEALSDTVIAEALDRHLCRCGVHQRVVRAVARAQVQAERVP